MHFAETASQTDIRITIECQRSSSSSASCLVVGVDAFAGTTIIVQTHFQLKDSLQTAAHIFYALEAQLAVTELRRTQEGLALITVDKVSTSVVVSGINSTIDSDGGLRRSGTDDGQGSQ